MPPIIEVISNLNPVILAVLATLFTWFMTALGAATVFVGKELNQKILDGLLGFAGGVMIAASYWSLLAPAKELSGKRTRAYDLWFTGFYMISHILIHINEKKAP